MQEVQIRSQLLRTLLFSAKLHLTHVKNQFLQDCVDKRTKGKQSRCVILAKRLLAANLREIKMIISHISGALQADRMAIFTHAGGGGRR